MAYFVFNPQTNELDSSDNPTPIRKNLGQKLLTKQIPQYGSPDTYGESFFEEDMPNMPDLLREEGIKIGEQVKNNKVYPWGYDKNPPYAFIPEDSQEQFLEDFDVRNETMHADGGRVGFNEGSKKPFGFGRDNYRTEKVTLGDKNYRYWLKKLYDEKVLKSDSEFN